MIVLKQGLVIRYAYLWHHEKMAGHEEARYDRPCMILSARYDAARQAIRVYVLPITHTQQNDTNSAIEIAASFKKYLGLDDGRSWIVTNQWNSFDWPGPDLRRIPRGPAKDKIVYGFFSVRMLRETARQVQRNLKENKVSRVRR